MIDHVLNIINSLSSYQWWLIGGFVASIPGVIAITEWVKRHHYKVKAEELWSGFVVLNVTVWSFVLTAADALSANYGQLTHIGSLLPKIAPYVAQYGPTLATTALTVHTVATAILKWWKDRQAKKPMTNPNLPTFTELTAITSPVTVTGLQSSSMGTAATRIDTAPPSDLFGN